MDRYRRLVALLLGGIVLGTLAASGGWAWFLRSEPYRAASAAALRNALGLPSDIGATAPLSHSARLFEQVTVWLPGRRDKALHCERAILTRTPTPARPEAYELDLRGGTAEISARTWLREDYRRVLESGLRPGFTGIGPQRVRFAEMDVQILRDRFALTLGAASGVVSFEDPKQGHVVMECRSLNGHDVDVPITLTGHFSPRTGGIQIDAVTLTVPELPIAEVELDALVGSRVRSGSFAGEVRYAEDGPDQTIRLRGRCSNLDLAEWTAGIAGHPWRGRGVEIALHELVVRNGAPLRLHFAGVLGDIGLADLLATWDLPPADGLVDLRVEDAVVSPAGIERFIAGGRCADLALEPLTGELGWGRMSGAADVLIEDLTVKFNRLSSFDGHLRVDPASGPLWIEGRLLTTLAEKLLAFRIPWQLPPRIPYTELGLTLEVRDEVLHIFGSHGPREKQILTVELVGQPVPLIREPEQSIDLRGWFDQLRAAGRAALEQHLLDLLREERNLEGDDGD